MHYVALTLCISLPFSLQLYREEVELQKDLPELRRLVAQAASAAGGLCRRSSVAVNATAECSLQRLTPCRSTHHLSLSLPPLLPALVTAGGAESDDLSEEAPRLLQLFLADSRRAAHTSASSARTFLLCQVRRLAVAVGDAGLASLAGRA